MAKTPLEIMEAYRNDGSYESTIRKALEDGKLTKEDWQYIAIAVHDRIEKAKPKKGEPPGSKEFTEMENRIMGHLLTKAYSR